jgi:hypothetical protein
MERELHPEQADRHATSALPPADAHQGTLQQLRQDADRTDDLIDQIDVRGAEQLLQSLRQRSAQ